jgi:hypothetical protein
MTSQAEGTKIEWEEVEPGYYVSLCDTFHMNQDQTYDVYHLYLTENDDYIGDGFMDDLTRVAQSILDKKAA